MNNLVILKKQHLEVLELMKIIEALIKRGDFEVTAKDIAYNINNMAGKLKVHLVSEDKFLYPNLMSSDNENIKNTAYSFNNEMGSLTESFTSFVKKYNIPSKILQNSGSFTVESKKVFALIFDRINKEDSELYPLLEE